MYVKKRICQTYVKTIDHLPCGAVFDEISSLSLTTSATLSTLVQRYIDNRLSVCKNYFVLHINNKSSFLRLFNKWLIDWLFTSRMIYQGI